MVNGERPIGAASCRLQHNGASWAWPPLDTVPPSVGLRGAEVSPVHTAGENKRTGSRSTSGGAHPTSPVPSPVCPILTSRHTLPFPQEVVPMEPPGCPCSTALCRVHAEEGNYTRRWPLGGSGGGGDKQVSPSTHTATWKGGGGGV